MRLILTHYTYVFLSLRTKFDRFEVHPTSTKMNPDSSTPKLSALEKNAGDLLPEEEGSPLPTLEFSEKGYRPAIPHDHPASQKAIQNLLCRELPGDVNPEVLGKLLGEIGLKFPKENRPSLVLIWSTRAGDKSLYRCDKKHLHAVGEIPHSHTEFSPRGLLIIALFKPGKWMSAMLTDTTDLSGGNEKHYLTQNRVYMKLLNRLPEVPAENWHMVEKVVNPDFEKVLNEATEMNAVDMEEVSEVLQQCDLVDPNTGEVYPDSIEETMAVLLKEFGLSSEDMEEKNLRTFQDALPGVLKCIHDGSGSFDNLVVDANRFAFTKTLQEVCYKGFFKQIIVTESDESNVSVGVASVGSHLGLVQDDKHILAVTTKIGDDKEIKFSMSEEWKSTTGADGTHWSMSLSGMVKIPSFTAEELQRIPPVIQLCQLLFKLYLIKAAMGASSGSGSALASLNKIWANYQSGTYAATDDTDATRSRAARKVAESTVYSLLGSLGCDANTLLDNWPVVSRVDSDACQPIGYSLCEKICRALGTNVEKLNFNDQKTYDAIPAHSRVRFSGPMSPISPGTIKSICNFGNGLAWSTNGDHRLPAPKKAEKWVSFDEIRACVHCVGPDGKSGTLQQYGNFCKKHMKGLTPAQRRGIRASATLCKHSKKGSKCHTGPTKDHWYIHVLDGKIIPSCADGRFTWSQYMAMVGANTNDLIEKGWVKTGF